MKKLSALKESHIVHFTTWGRWHILKMTTVILKEHVTVHALCSRTQDLLQWLRERTVCTVCVCEGKSVCVCGFVCVCVHSPLFEFVCAHACVCVCVSLGLSGHEVVVKNSCFSNRNTYPCVQHCHSQENTTPAPPTHPNPPPPPPPLEGQSSDFPTSEVDAVGHIRMECPSGGYNNNSVLTARGAKLNPSCPSLVTACNRRFQTHGNTWAYCATFAVTMSCYDLYDLYSHLSMFDCPVLSQQMDFMTTNF